MKCWTFHLRGGNPVHIKLGGNPERSHDGRLSIWHVMVSDKIALYLEQFLQHQGIQVNAHAEVEGAEQEAERDMIRSLSEDRVYRTIKCLECAFLDPALESGCGYEGWDEQNITFLLSALLKAREDVQACPVHGEG